MRGRVEVQRIVGRLCSFGISRAEDEFVGLGLSEELLDSFESLVEIEF